YLDGVGILELTRQRRHPAVHARAVAVQSNLRVHGECKIDRGCTLGQLYDVAGWREYEYLVLIQIQLEKFEKLVRRLGIELQLQHLAEPLEMPVQLIRIARVFLESPVRRDAVLCGAVHLARAYLDLEQLSAGSEHCCVQRLITVRLRLRDVILDPFLHRSPSVMDDTKCMVAIRNAVDENADSKEIVYLLVWLVAIHHLLVDGPEVLRPARDLDIGDSRARHFRGERFAHPLDEIVALGALLRNETREVAICICLEMLEGKILQLPAHLRHSETVRQRRVEIARFLPYAATLFFGKRLQRAHVVKPIGQLDDDDARVLGDREQQLAIVLDLRIARCVRRQVLDLGEAIDDPGDFLAELELDVGEGEARVLDHVVHEASYDCRGIEVEASENLGDRDAMQHVIFARSALLPPVRILAEPVSAQKLLHVDPLGKRIDREVPAGNELTPGHELWASDADRHLSI